MFKYIVESLSLDLHLFLTAPIRFPQKLELLFKKYVYLVLLSMRFVKGESCGRFWGETIYFPNRYGFLSIQRILVDCAFLKKYLPGSLSYLDVGAHAGEFSFFARKCLGSREVVSFEPDADTFDILKKNHQGSLHNVAVSNENSKTTLYLSSVSSQLNTIIKPDNKRAVEYQKSKEVSCARLDDFIPERYHGHNFDVLKIDVEGAEFEVIAGGLQVAKMADFIVLEMSIERGSSKPMIDFCAFLQKELPRHELIALNSYSVGERSIDMILRKV